MEIYLGILGRESIFYLFFRLEFGDLVLSFFRVPQPQKTSRSNKEVFSTDNAYHKVAWGEDCPRKKDKTKSPNSKRKSK